MSAMLYIHTAEPLKMLLKSDRESVKVSQTGHRESSTTADLHSVYLEVVKTAKIIGLLGSFVLTRKTSSVSHREDIADILNIQEIWLLGIMYNTQLGRALTQFIKMCVYSIAARHRADQSSF